MCDFWALAEPGQVAGMSGANDGDRAIPVPFHDGRGLPGRSILLPVLHDPVHPCLDGVFDLSKKSRGRPAGNIAGGKYDGVAEPFYQVPAERVAYQPDRYGAVRAGQAVRP